MFGKKRIFARGAGSPRRKNFPAATERRAGRRLTAMQLAGVIGDGLKKFINNPQVTVSVSEINSRRIYVTGEVTRPGSMPLLPNMMVMQALSSSGGFTQFAKIKNIYVLRVTDGKQEKLPFNYKEVLNGQKPEQNQMLKTRRRHRRAIEDDHEIVGDNFIFLRSRAGLDILLWMGTSSCARTKSPVREYLPLIAAAGTQDNSRETVTDLRPDDRPLTGVQEASLGTQEMRHSYWVPGFQYANVIRSTSFNKPGLANWNSTSYPDGKCQPARYLEPCTALDELFWWRRLLYGQH